MINTVNSWDIPSEPYIEEKDDKWEFCPKPQKDEAFLSWFVRLSIENCSDPRLLYTQLKNTSSLRNKNLDVIGMKLGSIQRNMRAQKEILAAVKPFIKKSIRKPQNPQYTLNNFKDPSNFLNGPLKFPRFCPFCLEKDEIPYIRDNWFYKPFLVCPIHHCLLLDTCPHCNSQIQFWNTSWRSDIIICSECGHTIIEDDIGTLILRNLDYYALIEQAFDEYKKIHKNANKSQFFQHLWINISYYSKDPLIKQIVHNDMFVSKGNLFRAMVAELKFIIEKPNRRKSLIVNKNGAIEYKFTIEDLEIYDGKLPKEYDNEIVMKRLNAIIPLLKLQHRTFEHVKKQSKNTGVASKTLYNWMKRYKEKGIEGLVPQHHKAGRKQKIYLPEIKELIDNYIERDISNPNKSRIVDCWNDFNKEAANRGFTSSQLPKRVSFYSVYTRKLDQKSKNKRI